MAPTAPAKQDFPSLANTSAYALVFARACCRRMREAEVAGQLGISRTPVREALRRLEADGFLTFEPHRGMVVVQLDHQSVMELYAMREALEGTAQHACEAEIANLCDMLNGEAAILDDP
jgi:DNA-binding GntR family transcriptional regulator